MKKKLNILVLGCSGMLGYSIFDYFNSNKNFNTYGTLRSDEKLSLFDNNQQQHILTKIDALDINSLEQAVIKSQANIIINCIGLIKQEKNFDDPKIAFPINSILPHQLANIALTMKARLIHFSTDCVFTGDKGNYNENDIPDSIDIYGVSKKLGEVTYKHTITLRTSIIGHELDSKKSLVDWFLNSSIEVNGYKNAIFSGLPTYEVARVLEKFVIPNNSLYGLYHLSANPINKYDLLNLIKEIYKKDIIIKEDKEFKIDRSLNSDIFKKTTGYNPPTWKELVHNMCKNKIYR